VQKTAYDPNRSDIRSTERRLTGTMTGEMADALIDEAIKELTD
jgi:hypothetical protein